MRTSAIDFEASCLPRHGRSFPIEVGVADERGAVAWLIRPEPAWDGWHWSAEAEALHGIDRATLAREGRPAVDVLDALAAWLAGRQAVADSRLDAAWIRTLAGVGRTAAPDVRHIADHMDALGCTDAEVATALAALPTPRPERHRAADDAAWLYGLVEKLEARAAARPMFGWARVPSPAREAAPH